MAAESTHSARCVRGRALVADRRTSTCCVGWTYRRRRARAGTGRDLHISEPIPGHDWTSLGSWTESFPAVIGRGAGSDSGRGGLRSSTGREIADVSVPVAALATETTAVGATRLDRVATVRYQRGRRGAVGIGRLARLRGVYETYRRAFDSPNDDCYLNRDQRGELDHVVPCGRISPASGSTHGRGGGRSRTWPAVARRVHPTVRGSVARDHGSNSASLRSDALEHRIHSNAVHDVHRTIVSARS